MVVLAIQYVLYNDIQPRSANGMAVIVATVAVVLGAVGIVYLTRAANDLPSMFLGHDADSEHVRLLPGVLALTIGLVLVGSAIAATRPVRMTDRQVRSLACVACRRRVVDG